MDHWEIEETLKTFRVIVDSREQMTPRAKERFKALGVPWERATLSYGDYAANVTLPGGQNLSDITDTLTPACVIERKMSLDEVASCFTRSRDRFRKEFERAAAAGARVFLLIEDGSIEGITNHRYKSRFNSTAFLASLFAWTIRYNLTPVMCRQGSSGRVIREILYRDIKERLERGDYG